MSHLMGLQDYLEEHYQHSIFDQAKDSDVPWEIHLHGHRTLSVRIFENLPYDLKAHVEGEGHQLIQKTDIKLIYPASVAEQVRPLIKTEKKVMDLGLLPIRSPSRRYHVKNKSLFPLMKDREVVFFTLLEGEIVKGIITDFSRYEITLSLKGGIPVTVLRHAIYDLRDKRGRCYLKAFQETHRDWEKSALYVSSAEG
jgi:sRNA-binding regulator protein Hfq